MCTENLNHRIGRRSITIIFHATSAIALLIATLVHSFGGKNYVQFLTTGMT